MSRSLRQKPRISYFEPEEPSLDEYVFCEKCADYVYEYCSIHGALLVIPDDKVPAKTNYPSFVPRAALTIPHVFLHINYSTIQGAGLGVFATLSLPSGVRFGPYRGGRAHQYTSDYSWQIYDGNNKPSHVVDASDGDKSNWMRYVNCARHWSEQNLVAFQYRGQLYYRTIKIIPRFTELMVFYGSEYANQLHIDIGKYNSPSCYAQKYGAPPKKPKLSEQNKKPQELVLKSLDENAESPKVTSLTKTPKVVVQETMKNEKISDVYKSQSRPEAPVPKNKTSHLEKTVAKPVSTSLALNNHKLQRHEIKSNTTKNEFCDHTSMSESNKKCHLLKHVGEKPYACSKCEYECSRADNLKRHLRTHTGEKPYACSKCDYKCSDSGNLKTHLRTHTGEKPYACNKCDYKCSQVASLKTHLRTHTGEKPYACSKCDYKCSQVASLKTHLRTHTGEKPYACSKCDYKCSQAVHLKTHLRTHTGEKPYACSKCEYKCSRADYLKTHLRTHTGEKPYACSKCEYKCSRADYLKTHLRTHTAEKPYACSKCDYKCSQAVQLKHI